LVANIGYAQNTRELILGEWVSDSRTKGGLGGAKFYSADGTLIITFGALVDFTYKVEGNILSIYSLENDLIKKQEISYVGEEIILKTLGTNIEEKLSRVDGDDDQTIVGKWEGSLHNTEAKQILHFTDTGNFYLSVPFASVTGKYQVNKHTLIETIEGKDPSEWRWRFGDNTLILEKTDGSKIERYIRKP